MSIDSELQSQNFLNAEESEQSNLSNTNRLQLKISNQELGTLPKETNTLTNPIVDNFQFQVDHQITCKKYAKFVPVYLLLNDL